MNTQTNNSAEINVVRRPVYTVKATEKRNYVARFVEHSVKKGHNIEEYVGKPLNWFDYEAIHKIVTEWDEELQTKIDLLHGTENERTEKLTETKTKK